MVRLSYLLGTLETLRYPALTINHKGAKHYGYQVVLVEELLAELEWWRQPHAELEGKQA